MTLEEIKKMSDLGLNITLGKIFSNKDSQALLSLNFCGDLNVCQAFESTLPSNIHGALVGFLSEEYVPRPSIPKCAFPNNLPALYLYWGVLYGIQFTARERAEALLWVSRMTKELKPTPQTDSPMQDITYCPVCGTIDIFYDSTRGLLTCSICDFECNLSRTEENKHHDNE